MVTGMRMSNALCLLLHGIGVNADMARVKSLFALGTMFVALLPIFLTANLTYNSQLFNTSGSGKTQLSLDSLCHHWGLYISCRTSNPLAATGHNPNLYSGSSDFGRALTILQEMSSWKHGRRQSAANCVFAMLVYLRIFVLTSFIKSLPKGTDSLTA